MNWRPISEYEDSMEDVIVWVYGKRWFHAHRVRNSWGGYTWMTDTYILQEEPTHFLIVEPPI